MSIFTRTRRLISANLHDWFDGLERPEKVAKQTLRELEESIAAATTATARSIAAERLLERRRDQLLAKTPSWEDRAADAARTSDDETLRGVLSRQFEARQALDEVQRQLAEASAVNATLRSQLDLMRSRHRRTQDRITMQTARRVAATAIGQVAESTSAASSSTATLFELEQACERTERSILETEARTELCRNDDHDADLRAADVRREQFVEEELRRLRAAFPAAS